jgi:antirestriction protein
MTVSDYTTTGGAQCPASPSPRIYVACLAAYNAGRLHGRWIDADQSTEDIWDEVQLMLTGSPEPGAEEWAIHDYEGFGQLRLSEWESFDRVAAIGAGIAAHGDAFSAWLSYDSSQDPTDTQSFEDACRGEWDSLRAYAENYADDVGMYDAAEKSGFSYVRVDIEMLERDLDIEMYTVKSDHYTVYVFDPNV